MLKLQRFIFSLVAVAVWLIPAATASAGVNLANHNETLLIDS